MGAEKLSAKERLELVKAERAAKEEADKGRREEELAEAELAAYEALPALEAAHGEVSLQMTVVGPVIVKGPSEPTYKRFRAAVAKGDERGDATEALAVACCVYPAPAEFAAMYAKKPGIFEMVANEAIRISGVTRPKS